MIENRDNTMSLASLVFNLCSRPGLTRSLTIGRSKRTYHVHVPKDHNPTTPTPLVLALHGATMNGPMMAWFSGLNQKADDAGFFVVYPNGTGALSSYTWNGGDCCGSAMRNNVDDVGFIKALLDDLAGEFRVDDRQVFATGMSNGAIMVYRLACELSDRIAAIAPVAGTMATKTCEPTRPVPVIHFHGTMDEFVPFNGGVGPKSPSGTNFRSVDHSIRTWVEVNGCDPKPITDVLSNGGDELRVTRTTYGAGKDCSEVVLVAIEGGGHTWPGLKSAAAILGRSALNVSANDLMWAFFQKHRRR
jgi:polyhydroxybutyrate depolymerase